MFIVACDRPKSVMAPDSSCARQPATRHLYLYSRPCCSSGFSLIELLIALTIVAILVLITTNFIPVLDQSKTRQVSDSLRAHIAQTRSESISRGGYVRLCGSTDGSTCTSSLDNGWIVYYDSDNNGSLGASDSILSRYTQDSSRLSITTLNGAGNPVSALGFDHRGFPTEAITVAVNSGYASNTVQLFANGRIALQ